MIRFLNDPLAQWTQFWQRRSRNYFEPTAVCLCTSDDNIPKARMVMLKGYTAAGFVFYSTTISDKAKDLLNNPHASISVYNDFDGNHMEVRGVVRQMTRGETYTYWITRNWASRIGAYASRQSAIIPFPGWLTVRILWFAAMKIRKYDMPDRWQGYILEPEEFYFLKHGSIARINDRVKYIKVYYTNKPGFAWVKERLYP